MALPVRVRWTRNQSSSVEHAASSSTMTRFTRAGLEVALAEDRAVARGLEPRGARPARRAGPFATTSFSRSTVLPPDGDGKVRSS